MTPRLVPPSSTDMVACRAGACSPDMVDAVRGELHDALIEANPVRSGPVRWAVYGCEDLDEVERILRLANFHPATDLLAYIARDPANTRLVIATVWVPARYARRTA
jgi:hypothetical protein